MEPLTDQELKELLATWRTPPAPPGLWARTEQARSRRWWRWLLTGSVRVPVPVGLAMLVALLALGFVVAGQVYSRAHNAPSTSGQTGFAGFQPVQELHPRVIRSKYERP